MAGGAVRSVLGYKNQADKSEGWNWGKFAWSVGRGGIAGLVIANSVDLPATAKGLVGAFSVAIGGDVFLKELYGATKG
jgi:hypothetical protein